MTHGESQAGRKAFVPIYYTGEENFVGVNGTMNVNERSVNMTYVNGCCISKEMLLAHAKEYDECVMGNIVVHALGINGSCIRFCICKAKGFESGDWINIGWILDNGDSYVKTFHVNEILPRLNHIKIVIKRDYEY